MLERGYYGRFGGAFVPEILVATFDELEAAYRAAKNDPTFWAEYEALIRALEELARLGARRALVKTDSQFVVRQFSGEYRAKDERMKALLSRVRALAEAFTALEGSEKAVVVPSGLADAVRRSSSSISA